MKLSPANLRELASLAIQAATEAGQVIAESRPSEVQYKKGAGESLASQVVTEIDRQSEEVILQILGPTLERFELGLLTEERDDDGSRLRADYFWCIDPLDGTLPFVEGSSGYAVSIALVGSDGIPHLGVVNDPAANTTFHAVIGQGAFRNDGPLVAKPESGGEVLSVFADLSFLELDRYDELAGGLQGIAQDMGLAEVQFHTTAGAVMNACGVLANPPACYVKYPKPVGGGSLWDFAATACLFQEMGAVATDIFGGRLDLNRADSASMGHRGVVFATGDVLAERVRALRSGTGGLWATGSTSS